MAQTSSSLNKPAEKIHALTSLRFFAALFVVLYHTYPYAYPEARGSLIDQIFSVGYVSVSFFFLLSGYILAMVYLRNGAPIRKSNFYAARFARVYPLFLITLLADTPYVVASRVGLYGWGRAFVQTVGTLAANLVMLQAWLPWLRGIDPPNWSLSVETVFYIIFPFIGVALWKLKGSRLWLTAIALWVTGVFIAAVIGPHFSVFVSRLNPLFHICTFPLGILLARWQLLRREERGERQTSGLAISITLLVCVGLFAALIRWGLWIPSPVLNSSLLLPMFAAIIWACSGSRSWIARILSVKWLVVLGEASFGLYLIHQVVHHMLIRYHLQTSHILYPFYLAFCIGLSVLSFYFVETPLRKWILKSFRARTKETMEAASDAQ